MPKKRWGYVICHMTVVAQLWRYFLLKRNRILATLLGITSSVEILWRNNKYQLNYEHCLLGYTCPEVN
jgi:hypothetical protein